jgi:hypothetical protein
VWQVNEYQKNFDLFLKIFCYVCAAWWLLGLLKYLPDDLSNRIVNALIAKLPI